MDNWIESLPEDLRGHETLTKFDSPAALAKSFVELERFQGQSLRLPSDNAGDEDRAAFLTRLQEKVPELVMKPVPGDEQAENAFWQGLGRPDEVTGYEKIEGLSDDQQAYMREIAFQSSLTDKQYKAMVGALSERFTAEQSEIQAAAQAERDEYFDTLGAAKDATLEALKQFGVAVGMDESLMAAIGEEGNPKVMALLDTLRKKIGTEGGALEQQIDERGNMTMTPAEAEAEIGEILNRTEYHSDTGAIGRELRRRHRELEGYVAEGNQQNRRRA